MKSARYASVLALVLVATIAAATPRDARLLKSVPPVYPDAEQRAGHEGVAQVRIQINHFGKVAQVGLSLSSGFPALDEAALTATKDWIFAPAHNEDGEAIEAEVIVPIRFQLDHASLALVTTTNTRKEVDDLLKQPCARINEQVKTYQSANPSAPLTDMSSFKQTTAVFVPPSFGLDGVGDTFRKLNAMPEVYSAVVEQCAAGPALVYGDVFLKNYKAITQRP